MIDDSNFRVTARQAVETYKQRGMVIEAVFWGRIVDLYEAELGSPLGQGWTCKASITLTSLANCSYKQSAAVDNTIHPGGGGSGICGTFNGAGKEWLKACRVCGAPRGST